MNYRCFDLGGSGLKTRIHRDVVEETDTYINLGIAPHNEIAFWIRQQLSTLADEVAENYIFSFALAGLDKLSRRRNLHNRRDHYSISALFQLPESRVYTINDGDAHLLASRTQLGITSFPHLNFSIGTGVGIGMYDAQGELVSEFEIRQQLQKHIWDFLVDSTAANPRANFALADQGYKELIRFDPVNANQRFEARWLRFLEHQLLPRLGQKPRTITFSGEVVHYGNLFCETRTWQGCQIRRGPPSAGLLGAKLNAEQQLDQEINNRSSTSIATSESVSMGNVQ